MAMRVWALYFGFGFVLLFLERVIILLEGAGWGGTGIVDTW